MNTSAYYTILPQPCGCAVEVSRMSVWGSIIECYWCDATFNVKDFDKWIEKGAAQPLLLECRPRPLFKFGDRILELLGTDDSGVPIVREKGGAEFMMDVPEHVVERLEN